MFDDVFSLSFRVSSSSYPSVFPSYSSPSGSPFYSSSSPSSLSSCVSTVIFWGVSSYSDSASFPSFFFVVVMVRRRCCGRACIPPLLHIRLFLVCATTYIYTLGFKDQTTKKTNKQAPIHPHAHTYPHLPLSFPSYGHLFPLHLSSFYSPTYLQKFKPKRLTSRH